MNRLRYLFLRAPADADSPGVTWEGLILLQWSSKGGRKDTMYLSIVTAYKKKSLSFTYYKIQQ